MTILTKLGKGLGVVVLAVALLLGSLQANCGCCRSRFFATLFGLKGVEPTRFTREVVCPHLHDVHGTVVDVGTGTGVSLACYANNTNISALVLVEPNVHMIPYLETSIARFGLQEKTRVVVGFLSDAADTPSALRVASGSADFVASLHLLCSVDPAHVVGLVQTVARVLKPGTGRYKTIDHSADEPGTFMRAVQTAIEPAWRLISNGCAFLDMPEAYAAWFTPHNGFATRRAGDEAEFHFPVMGRLVNRHVRGDFLAAPPPTTE